MHTQSSSQAVVTGREVEMEIGGEDSKEVEKNRVVLLKEVCLNHLDNVLADKKWKWAVEDQFKLIEKAVSEMEEYIEQEKKRGLLVDLIWLKDPYKKFKSKLNGGNSKLSDMSEIDENRKKEIRNNKSHFGVIGRLMRQESGEILFPIENELLSLYEEFYTFKKAFEPFISQNDILKMEAKVYVKTEYLAFINIVNLLKDSPSLWKAKLTALQEKHKFPVNWLAMNVVDKEKPTAVAKDKLKTGGSK